MRKASDTWLLTSWEKCEPQHIDNHIVCMSVDVSLQWQPMTVHALWYMGHFTKTTTHPDKMPSLSDIFKYATVIALKIIDNIKYVVLLLTK